jgi:tetratricopeptide (TPR) repeat protein
MCFLVSFVLLRLAVAHAPVEERIEALNKMIDQDQKNADLFLERGGLYSSHGEWTPAVADFERAAELNPDLAEVDMYLGRMFLASGRPVQAEKALKRFLLQVPNHAEARVTLAMALVKLGRRREAVVEYTRAIKLCPSPAPRLYLERAKALIDEGDGYVDEALRGLDEGIQKLGPIITLQLYAIDLELKKNQFDAALLRLEHITAKASRKETWLAQKGDILEKAGRTDQALVAFTSALAAIQKLPAHRKSTQTMTQLKARVIESQNRLMVTLKSNKDSEK